MRVIYPQSMTKQAAKEGIGAKHRHDENGPNSLIQVQNAPRWTELDIRGARAHVGPFLEYMKNNHDEQNPAFTSKLLIALDESDADQEKAIESLRAFGAVISFTDLLALLGPAVEYALALMNDKNSRTPENIEKFVIALVLALAEATNQFGDEELIPLDDDLIEGITVTVRNIVYAFHKDFDKINYGGQITFVAKLFDKFGGRCLAGCVGCCRKK